MATQPNFPNISTMFSHHNYHNCRGGDCKNSSTEFLIDKMLNTQQTKHNKCLIDFISQYVVNWLHPATFIIKKIIFFFLSRTVPMENYVLIIVPNIWTELLERNNKWIIYVSHLYYKKQNNNLYFIQTILKLIRIF